MRAALTLERKTVWTYEETCPISGQSTQPSCTNSPGRKCADRAVGGEELGGGLADAGTRAGCKIYRLNFGETWLSVVQRSLDIEGVCWMGRFLGRVIQRTLLV